MSRSATGATESGMLLRPRHGRPFRFDAGALCLELLLTGGPGPIARQYESLDDPEGLRDWARDSRLPDGLPPDLPVTGDDLAAARTLRDALWRLALARADGAPYDPGALAVLNAAAAAPPLAPALAPDGARAWAPGATAGALLSTVARDAVDLLTGPHADRVRVCGADDCSLLFADTSRPGARRWCSMARCGNRHKARAHRAAKD
ncbi:CGNR zinc finger domain-containing protein [Streptomyces termitum]|nr:ABATE domain-containing protein [Streptomyces termitum]